MWDTCLCKPPIGPWTYFLLFFNEIVILTSDVLAQVPGRWKEVAYILCSQIVA